MVLIARHLVFLIHHFNFQDGRLNVTIGIFEQANEALAHW